MPQHILFLCRENSARSIMAEALINRHGQGQFIGHSAGTYPAAHVHPFTGELLEHMGFDTGFARPKSSDEFSGPNAIQMDYVFTLCDQLAAETCPIWPGHPVTAHWDIPNPQRIADTEPEAVRRLAFAECYRMLRNRISVFVNLPNAQLDPRILRQTLDHLRQPRRA